jgi:hypothetical protein
MVCQLGKKQCCEESKKKGVRNISEVVVDICIERSQKPHDQVVFE